MTEMLCDWCWCLLFTDVDECAPGGSAEACSASNGTCDGTQPPGSFTCVCNVGYHLVPNGTMCEGMITCVTTATMTVQLLKHNKNNRLHPGVNTWALSMAMGFQSVQSCAYFSKYKGDTCAWVQLHALSGYFYLFECHLFCVLPVKQWC